jgi:colanic acid biosynthesis glycosyl transferase WcaI
MTLLHRARNRAARMQMKQILFLNRSYWPDAEATGQLLTELCEDLSPSFGITVIAGQPNDNPTQASFRRNGTEMRNGVRIRRVRHTRFPKRFLPGRLCNYLSFLIGAFWAAMWIERPDVVVVETDPPLLCLVGFFLKWFRGAKLVCYLQDIHPDIGIALGKFRDSWVLRLLRRLLFSVYRRADRLVVLSRDMRDHIARSNIDPQKIECIPNWVDTSVVRPVKEGNAFRKRNGINGQFVVMYSGNLGLCQRLEDVVAAAGCLRGRSDILFLLVGEGALKAKLRQQVEEQGLSNVTFLPYQPKSELSDSLSAADVHLVPLDERVASCLMPSKLYGILASGTPLVAVAPDDCELAELALEHGIGVLAPPGEPAALAEVIEKLADRTWDLPQMGDLARLLAVTHYDRRRVVPRFCDMLRNVLGSESQLHLADQWQPGRGQKSESTPAALASASMLANEGDAEAE